uniref:Sorting nexin 29 n=1 Tax=Varanus komodoensis TaxID=61221 RepID=A0A8D2JL17_VARKO
RALFQNNELSPPPRCQIRFGGRKEIASDSDSRVTCLCAQFESVLQHGLKRTRGLALTAAALRQAAGFSSKSEMEPVFWFYVKEVLNKHELQRFYSLRNIMTDVGRGRAWLRCALNEHSLERYFHMLLADKNRLSVFYEDWSFMMDEERSSMIPTMAAGLNSILFAINIDNKDLNGQSKCPPTVSDLLKESTQNVTSLLKESTQGVSSLFREITASSPVSMLIKSDQEADPLPILSKSVSGDLKCRKERMKKKKKVTNIISFDDEEDEQHVGDDLRASVAGESSEENSDRSLSSLVPPSVGLLAKLNGEQSMPLLKNSSTYLNGDCSFQKLDVKSIDDDDDDDADENDGTYGKMLGNLSMVEDKESSDQGQRTQMALVRCESQCFSTWNGSQLLKKHNPYLLFTPPPRPVSFSAELRQAIVAMMNRKHELEEQNGSLRNLLDGEMEHSAGLRQEIDNLKKKVSEQEERYTVKIQALARENEVLKVQLKKYVGAVQMLKREGQAVEVLPTLWNSENEFTIPEQKQGENNEELANSYERKLIEVAEMHGELIEFNERLHRALMAKDALVTQMRQELIDLRGPPIWLGPPPGLFLRTCVSNRALINVWIPSVFLRGKAANAFHVYQVYIRIKDDEWNVYRRYAEFRTLHHKLQMKYHQVRSFNFPPKKAIGNKDAKFVEERRKQLQIYLRNVMNKVIQILPEFTANPKKETLTQLMPFVIDFQPVGESAGKSNRPRGTARFPKLSRSQQREARNLEPQSGDL